MIATYDILYEYDLPPGPDEDESPIVCSDFDELEFGAAVTNERWQDWAEANVIYVDAAIGAMPNPLGRQNFYAKLIAIAGHVERALSSLVDEQKADNARYIQLSRMTWHAHDTLLRKGLFAQQQMLLRTNLDRLSKMMVLVGHAPAGPVLHGLDQAEHIKPLVDFSKSAKQYPWLVTLCKGKDDRLTNEEYRALFDGLHYLPPSEHDKFDAALEQMDVARMPAEAMTALLRYTHVLRGSLPSWDSFLERVRLELSCRGYNSDQKLRGLNAA